MLGDKTNVEPSGLDKAISDVLTQMEGYDADSPEFARMVEQLDKLHKMRTYKREPSVKLDTVLAVAGNLAGIVIILGFERAHVITSKALGFVIKSRA